MFPSLAFVFLNTSAPYLFYRETERGVSKSGRPTLAWNMATRDLTTAAIFTCTHITPKHPD